MFEALSVFSTWVAGRALGKVLFFAFLALPVLAVVGYIGFSKRRKND